ncbi:hypothetical protein K493DRAFT_346855 [Basidiobolus meristosporus CBS 931.73]|uniref:SGF29 C-terminal domain-containing protein n=1 Tax=Basidiobolus meristosporus CBS 931.73 TaxID=1314790 RepID=A0A1Y1YXG3_9FUNG|nr:hypothetical protein K493DRAFT_346855 [Basidiobolus meristosporus CBS 931.73]|eukprot:ORY02245.1 hypothetical protein K493DRAFT_346855 [Basidiobolus meristosporus CBS 931.73]
MKPLELAQQFKRRGAFDEIRKCLLNDFKNHERGKKFQESVVRMLTEITTRDPSLFKKDRFAFQNLMMKEMEKKISLAEVELETKRLLEEAGTYTSKMESELRAILQASTNLPKDHQQETSQLKKRVSEVQKSSLEDPLSLLDSILSFSNTATNSVDRMKKKSLEIQGDLTRKPSSGVELSRHDNSSPRRSEFPKNSTPHGYSPPHARKQSKDGSTPRAILGSASEDQFGESDRFVVRRRSSTKDGERLSSSEKLRFQIDQRVAAFVPIDGDELQEKCYIVVVRKYDPATEKYVVRDPEAIAGEKDTWKVPEDKIYDYKRNKKLVERGENPFSVGDRVYSLYKDRETDETSTEFYEAVIEKIGKSTVLVKFLDDSGDTSRLYYDELFKVNKKNMLAFTGQSKYPKIKLKIKKESPNNNISRDRNNVTKKLTNGPSEGNERSESPIENTQDSNGSFRKQKRRRLVALVDDDDDDDDDDNDANDSATHNEQVTTNW